VQHQRGDDLRVHDPPHAAPADSEVTLYQTVSDLDFIQSKERYG
jgi:hypothetical protein